MMSSVILNQDDYIVVLPSNSDEKYIFDEEMKTKLENYTWHVTKKGYLSTFDYKDKKQILAHHLVVGKPKTGFETDHADRNKKNNRKCNLRHVSHAQNRINAKVTLGSKSGFKGVSLYKPTNKWRARIGYNGKKITIGYFDCPKMAAKQYDKKAIELFGEYACTNNSLGLIQ